MLSEKQDGRRVVSHITEDRTIKKTLSSLISLERDINIGSPNMKCQFIKNINSQSLKFLIQVSPLFTGKSPEYHSRDKRKNGGSDEKDDI